MHELDLLLHNSSSPHSPHLICQANLGLLHIIVFFFFYLIGDINQEVFLTSVSLSAESVVANSSENTH